MRGKHSLQMIFSEYSPKLTKISHPTFLHNLSLSINRSFVYNHIAHTEVIRRHFLC